jgi:transposase
MKKNKVKKRSQLSELSQVNLDAAGIDIGSTSHFVAVPPGRDEVSVREFASFTSELYQLADWLSTCGITTVAMESTGVYELASLMKSSQTSQNLHKKPY